MVFILHAASWVARFLKCDLQTELDLAGGTEGNQARSETHPIGEAFRRGCAVERSNRAVQNAAQAVAWTVEVGKIKNVEPGNAGLQHKTLADLERPGKCQVEGSQPCQIWVAGGSQ